MESMPVPSRAGSEPSRRRRRRRIDVGRRAAGRGDVREGDDGGENGSTSASSVSIDTRERIARILGILETVRAVLTGRSAAA